MCGIVGYIGTKNCQPILVDGLRRLEYRGYDSSGIAVVSSDGVTRTLKCKGKIAELEQRLLAHPLKGHVGIGHTRWATHGAPSDVNAHPHSARCGPSRTAVTVVHNGIIENYQELKRNLNGHRLQSQTDTEVVAHLIEHRLNGSKSLSQNVLRTPPERRSLKAPLQAGPLRRKATFPVAEPSGSAKLMEPGLGFGIGSMDLHKALARAWKDLRGAYALGILIDARPDVLIATRKGSPLVLGIGEGENFIASDIPALLPYTRRISILEDGDVAFLSADRVNVFDFKGRRVNRPVKEILWSQTMAEKGGYKHFMLKEIHEQPHAALDTIRGRVAQPPHKIRLDELADLPHRRIERIVLTACGTSYHAALVGKAAIEQIAGRKVESDIASEARYRPALFDRNTLVIAVSQSGETADTLACVEEAKKRKSLVLAISNVVDSSLPRRSDFTVYTRAGPEIGVASTKTFTTQIIALLMIALELAERKAGGNLGPRWMRRTIRSAEPEGSATPVGLRSGPFRVRYDAEAVLSELGEDLLRLPDALKKVLRLSDRIRESAAKFFHLDHFLYLGRGALYPIAMEGALKLKEISYIHAEAYAGGEMKHGPIALIDENMPVVVFVGEDETKPKILANIEEAASRGGKIIAVTGGPVPGLEKRAEAVFRVPRSGRWTQPILMSVVVQLLAYHMAVLKGTDVDQPRNLAKSVTVE